MSILYGNLKFKIRKELYESVEALFYITID